MRGDQLAPSLNQAPAKGCQRAPRRFKKLHEKEESSIAIAHGAGSLAKALAGKDKEQLRNWIRKALDSRICKKVK